MNKLDEVWNIILKKSDCRVLIQQLGDAWMQYPQRNNFWK